MSNIIAFRPRAVRRGGAPARPDTPASVVIFPGVRYERAPQTERQSRTSIPATRDPARPNPT